MARTFDQDEGKKRAKKKAEALFEPKKKTAAQAKAESKGKRASGEPGKVLPADAPSDDGTPTTSAIRHYMSELVKSQQREASIRGQIADVVKKRGNLLAEAEAAGIPRKILKRLVEDDGKDQGAAIDEERTYRAFARKANVQLVMAFEEAPTPDAKKRVRGEGYNAGLKGKSSSENPHQINSEFFNVWHEGWLEGQAKLAEGFNAKPGAKPDEKPAENPAKSAAATPSPAAKAAGAAGIGVVAH